MPVTFEIEDDELLRDLYEKGRLDGEAKVLRFLLLQKFGSLSHAHEDRINGATHEELRVWVARVMPATSIDEIFNG